MRKTVRIADVEKLLGKEAAAQLATGIDKLKAKPKRGPIPFIVRTRWVFTASQEIDARTGYDAVDHVNDDIGMISDSLKRMWREHIPVVAEVVFDSPNMRDGFILPVSISTERKFKIERRPRPAKVNARIETGAAVDKTTVQGGALRVQRRRRA